jgi:hypothetical protein
LRHIAFKLAGALVGATVWLAGASAASAHGSNMNQANFSGNGQGGYQQAFGQNQAAPGRDNYQQQNSYGNNRQNQQPNYGQSQHMNANNQNNYSNQNMNNHQYQNSYSQPVTYQSTRPSNYGASPTYGNQHQQMNAGNYQNSYNNQHASQYQNQYSNNNRNEYNNRQTTYAKPMYNTGSGYQKSYRNQNYGVPTQYNYSSNRQNEGNSRSYNRVGYGYGTSQYSYPVPASYASYRTGGYNNGGYSGQRVTYTNPYNYYGGYRASGAEYASVPTYYASSVHQGYGTRCSSWCNGKSYRYARPVATCYCYQFTSCCNVTACRTFGCQNRRVSYNGCASISSCGQYCPSYSCI